MDAVGPSVVNGTASNSDASNIDSLRYLFSQEEETEMNDASLRARSATRGKKKQNAAKEKGQESFAPDQDTVTPEPVLTRVFSHNAVPDLGAAENFVPDFVRTEETTAGESDVDAIVSESTTLSSQDVASAADFIFASTTESANLTEAAISAEAQTSFAPPEYEDVQGQAKDITNEFDAGHARGEVDSINAAARMAVQRPTDDKVSRSDLVNVLEGFVNLIRNTGDNPQAESPRQISYEQGAAQQKLTLQVDDKTAEVEELRCLLVEAQETIIRLLTDRVEDRARISQLESELRLLPDLQAQADRALAVAMNTEDFRRELTRVKFELERVRLAKVRAEVDKNHRSWLRGVRGWFFKTRENMNNRDVELKVDR
jgi:hypothetical protein